MDVLHGTVVDGKIVLQGGELPEGTRVTVVANQTAELVLLPQHLLSELNEAIEEADADENPGITPAELFQQLEKYR
jgi:hypothetical protein